MIGWDIARTELLKKCVDAGLSASEAAMKIGDVSRNGCIGKALRMGWHFKSGHGGGRSTSEKEATRPIRVVRVAKVEKPPKAPPVKPSAGNPGGAASRAATAARKQISIAGNGMTFEPAPAAAMPKLRIVAATGEPARIIDPHFGGCKWPINDPGAGRMHETLFCCGPRDPTKPYCEAHLKLAWNGLPKKPKAASTPSVGSARGPGGHRYAFGGGVQ